MFYRICVRHWAMFALGRTCVKCCYINLWYNCDGVFLFEVKISRYLVQKRTSVLFSPENAPGW
jgi:hypothetical protein